MARASSSKTRNEPGARHPNINTHTGEFDPDRTIFEQARKYVKTGRIFRAITYLYGEKKIIATFLIHFVSTMIIWAHFALIKFQEQAGKVPEGAHRYWWKRIAPPLEFGSMHAILFQMALIPLTMSRLSISVASSTVFDKLIPFNRAVRFHIHLGYTMISIVFFATAFFFAFFGLLCSEGDQQFCSKFTSEIMITGYCIIGLLLLVGVSSFLRDRIKYELFYALHHLVFLIYAVTTIHTLDVVHRTGERDRSQSFKWFSATILYYICDRAALAINHTYRTSIAASSAVTSSKGTRMAIIKVHRPALFHFKPGQYCMLRIRAIDRHWHPFSIASGPESDYLEFYMEVYGRTSWTNKLWNMISEHKNEPLNPKTRTVVSHQSITVEVKGPYGTSLGKVEEFSHALVIGSGTGIVPILSMLKQHIYQLRRLDVATYKQEKELRDRKTMHLHMHQQTKRSSNHFLGEPFGLQKAPRSYSVRDLEALPMGTGGRLNRSRLSTSIQTIGNAQDTAGLKISLNEIKREAARAMRPIYGAVATVLLPAFGVAAIGLTISWNTLPIELYPSMDIVLQVVTIVFQALFGLVAIFFMHDKSHFLFYVDLLMVLISAFADWYWFERDLWASFSTSDLCNYILLAGYMTLRLWYTAVNARKSSWRKDVTKSGFVTLDKVDFVWITRSASLVSKILPDISYLWDSLCEAWGEDAAKMVCDIRIYVTDKDEQSCNALADELKPYLLGRMGVVQFNRPNIRRLIEDYTLDRIYSERTTASNTLLAFCGSPSLSAQIHHAKTENDISTVISGHSLHKMEYVSESYGHSKSGKQAPSYSFEDGANAKGRLEQDANSMVSQRSMRLNKVYNSASGDVFYDDDIMGQLKVHYTEPGGLANGAGYEVLSFDEEHDESIPKQSFSA